MTKADIKQRANDTFIAHTNSEKNFKILVSRNFIIEINNVLFLYDKEIKIWKVANADFAWVAIPNQVSNNNIRIWTLLLAKKKLSGKIKATHKPMPCTFDIAEDQIETVLEAVSSRNLNFKETYNIFKEALNLPEYSLKD